MPKPVSFKSGSVVYFQGDRDERVYILKSGRIMLKSQDIETGQVVQDMIQTGEFFGVKSAMGRSPREEDALVLSDAQVIQFTVPEFETLVTSNTRVIIKMLKVFSNQLRRVHVKVSSMLNQVDLVDPEEGLHRSAEFYFRNRQFNHSTYIWTRYLELYPTGRFAERANEGIAQGRTGSSATPAASRTASAPASRGAPRSELPPAGQRFFEGETALANERYAEALEAFREVAGQPDAGSYAAKARFEIGRALYYSGDFAATVRHYSAFLKESPRHPQGPEMMLYLGLSYAKAGDRARGSVFLQKAAAGAADDPELARRITRAQAEVGGA